MKYIAIKVKGLNYYLWFKTENVKEEGGKFEGKEGWGKSNAFIQSFECSTEDIVSRMSTDGLGIS